MKLNHLRCNPLKALTYGALILTSQSACADTQHSTRNHNTPSQLTPYLSEKLQTPADINQLPSEIHYDLTIEMIESSIFNPATQRNDKVNLRGYRDTNILLTQGNAPFRYVAPTINMRPGQTVRMMLRNKLAPESNCTHMPDNINIPHCFNGTNMHTHGLWISPSGNSDNVLLKIAPQVNFQYEYNVPSDHPAGTFWYHPHLHGSTALQVGSGMAGALIIRGDREPVYENGNLVQNGDLDLLLKDFDEELLVMQQVPYACFTDVNGNPKPDKEIWKCAEGEVGTVESYSAQFGLGSWGNSKRYTTINGEVLSHFTGAKVGELQRWRFIHAGTRDSISLRFRKMENNARPYNSKAISMKDYVTQNCTGELLDYHLVASDGLTMSKALISNNAVTQPGYRWDALVQFPEQGTWCLIDGDMPSAGSINGEEPSTNLLGTIEVGSSDMPPTSALNQLIAAAKKNLTSGKAREHVINELKSGLRLTAFVPHTSLLNDPAENFGKQELAFNIFIAPEGSAEKNRFAVANSLDPQEAKPYQTGVINRELILGTKEEWIMTSGLAAHPFHIHVNPFQIVEILKPVTNDECEIQYDEDNKIQYIDVSGPGAQDDTCKEKEVTEQSKKKVKLNDPQYPGMKGLWKDTIMVKQDYKIKVRTHYQRYIGDFVLHCHILDHEDQGMMQNVRISIPNGLGGAATAHH